VGQRPSERGDDARLIALSDQYLRLEEAYAGAGLREDDATAAAVHQRMVAVYDQLCAMEARTEPGRRAKARAVMQAVLKEADNRTPCRWDEKLAWSLARDVLRH
jgi:hypothetical protein